MYWGEIDIIEIENVVVKGFIRNRVQFTLLLAEGHCVSRSTDYS